MNRRMAALAALTGLALAGIASAQQPAPTYFLGDVDCDRTVTSIDAALLLQREGGLLESLACPGNADLNLDGMINSADAGLILQYVADLVPGFVTMSLNVTGPQALCDDAEKPGQCYVPVGTDFRLSLRISHPPIDGYVLASTLLFHGDLRYNPTTLSADEVVLPGGQIVARWPHPDDGPPVSTARLVAHVVETDTSPSTEASRYRGDVIALSMSCPAQPRSFRLVLLPLGDHAFGAFGSRVRLADQTIVTPLTFGRLDIDFDGTGTIEAPGETDVAAVVALIVNCVVAAVPTATPAL